MGLESRPYIGSFKLGSQKLIQVTPDTMVYINGDLSIPGCQKCHSSIDLQKFITEVSVDAGTDPSSASASFSLSIPSHQRDSFTRDAQFILRAGLEVHVYMRGYFPVKGMYSNLAVPTSPPVIESDATAGTKDVVTNDKTEVVIPPKDQWSGKRPNGQIVMSKEQWKTTFGGVAQSSAEQVFPGDPDAQKGFVALAIAHSYEESGGSPSGAGSNNIFGKHSSGNNGYDWAKYDSYEQAFVQYSGETSKHKWYTSEPAKSLLRVSPATAITYNMYAKHYGDAPWASQAIIGVANNMGYDTGETYYSKHMAQVLVADSKLPKDEQIYDTAAARKKLALSEYSKWEKSPEGKALLDKAANQSKSDVTAADKSKSGTTQATTGPSTLESMGLGGYDIENVLAYPYYHVFHGVVTQVSHSYSSGSHTASVQCVSMLHFWQYHQMSTNASLTGQRPHNSNNHMNLVGNNFTGKHPYEIMYALHRDTAGAAAGVAWATSQKTNVDAVSELTNESFYSLSLKYWQKRFALGNIKLRMHGVTGELLNSMQAAFLSNLSTSELTSLIRNRHNNAGVGSNDHSILSRSIAVGLYNNRKLDTLVQAQLRAAPGKNKSSAGLDINMAEMTAFVSELSQFAQVQLFESTYESKLDIANKVCEVTGFEFFQDVDGDFVFKPPMYNMDTSSSRVYRIEDIDIITINFEEKEPQVTYMVCKGSHWHNRKIGVDNEWGVRGDYVDFRLVSQFGWRPGNFESSYFTDPKSMFLAAASRLDIMNAPTHSASVTIPIRPEMRPGYPVYIPYLDAFYYCNSFAHSFSVGGSCTTSLQLIAKRAKFFAPGNPADRGIKSINLSDTSLPEKPLEVLDNDGRPRLSGFPNVVMALDPHQIDPLFFVVGTDTEKLNDSLTLEFMMKKASALGIVTPWPDPTRPGPYYFMKTGNNGEEVWFYFQTENSVDGATIKTPPTDAPIRLGNGNPVEANKKQKYGTQGTADRGPKQLALKKEAAIREKELADMQSRNPDDFDTDKMKRASQAAADAGKASDTYEANTAAELATTNGKKSKSDDSNVSAFDTLVKKVMEATQRPTTFQSSYSGDPNSSIVLLEMMSNRKSIFSNNSIPGQYRYYSSSHPDETQQGQDLLTISIRKDADTQSKRVVTSPSYLSPTWSGTQCPTYVKEPSATQDGHKPEAEIRDATPKRGISVFTSNPKFAQGEILPTFAIREVMFASHQIMKHDLIHSKGRTNVATFSGSEFVDAWRSMPAQYIGNPQPGDSVEKVMSNWVLAVNTSVSEAVKTAKSGQTKEVANRIPQFPGIDLPSVVVYWGGKVTMTVPLNSYRFLESPHATNEAWPGSSALTIRLAWDNIAPQYGEDYLNSFVRANDTWKLMLADRGLSQDVIDKIETDFYNSVAADTGVRKSTNMPRVKSNKIKSVKGRGDSTSGSVLVSTAVFPISDSKGYRVVGSYRYGRDVTIDPDGVFDVLHRQDVFSMLNKSLVDDILNTFVQGKSIWAEFPEMVNGKKKVVKKQLSGTEAKTYLQQKAVEVLRKNYSDGELGALGVLKFEKDGTVLDVALNNWIANSKDGITKLPVINSAYSLADLAPHTSRDFCTCKAAEASVLLDIAGTHGFEQFTESGKKNYGNASGDASVDKTIQWVKQTTAASGIPWTQSQAALRGSVPNQKPVSVVKAVSGLPSQLAEVARKVDASNSAVEAAKKKI